MDSYDPSSGARANLVGGWHVAPGAFLKALRFSESSFGFDV